MPHMGPQVYTFRWGLDGFRRLSPCPLSWDAPPHRHLVPACRGEVASPRCQQGARLPRPPRSTRGAPGGSGSQGAGAREPSRHPLGLLVSVCSLLAPSPGRVEGWGRGSPALVDPHPSGQQSPPTNSPAQGPARGRRRKCGHRSLWSSVESRNLTRKTPGREGSLKLVGWAGPMSCPPGSFEPGARLSQAAPTPC